MYRAYMETAMNASSAGRPRGVTLAAAMVPMPLTAMSLLAQLADRRNLL